MRSSSEQSRRVQLVSERHVVASLAALAWEVGVDSDDIERVVEATQRVGVAALLHVEGGSGGPCLDAVELPEDVETLRDDVRFVAWLHQVAGRRACWYARTAWVARWYALRAGAPVVAEAVPQQTGSEGGEVEEGGVWMTLRGGGDEARSEAEAPRGWIGRHQGFAVAIAAIAVLITQSIWMVRGH